MANLGRNVYPSGGNREFSSRVLCDMDAPTVAILSMLVGGS